MYPPVPGLPDPEVQPDFYSKTATKRLLAWVVDAGLIALTSVILSALTLFTALLIWPLLYLTVGFFYRWITLSGTGATPGMRLMSIRLLRLDGAPLDAGTAFWHTATYTVACAVFPLQLISAAMMLLSDRGKGLVDTLLGTAMTNR